MQCPGQFIGFMAVQESAGGRQERSEGVEAEKREVVGRERNVAIRMEDKLKQR